MKKDRIWWFDKNAGMALLIPIDTPAYPCKDEKDLRRIAAALRSTAAKGGG